RGRKRNNHWYWLGAGLAATATTTDSERHWKLAREIYADAAREITAEGFLPMELERKSRALYYHAFALMPLVTMAELASARGENWASLGDDALHRLAERTRAGLLDSGPFDKRAGAAQERPLKPGAGWLELYAIRHADRLQSPRVDMPPGHRWLGGDVRLLAEALKPRAN
ncbi:MAG TPA: alginate lyase family protein, partial [Hyphomicrobiaceae bacterium]|nr:alginate lyase family protein [Hyphomicrobiaceae bacterium]